MEYKLLKKQCIYRHCCKTGDSLHKKGVMLSRLFIFSLLLITVNLFCHRELQAASVLTTVNRSDESTSLQLFFHFDFLPESRLQINGRRVDLELSNTTTARQLPLPAADGRMIKIVPKQLPTKTIISIYFRYPPKKSQASATWPLPCCSSMCFWATNFPPVILNSPPNCKESTS